MTTPLADGAHPKFLISDAEYSFNIRRQKRMAQHIARMVELAAVFEMDSLLDDTDRAFLAAQRKWSIPALGRGRPPNYDGLSDAEYALLRTNRLSESADNLNPDNKGAPRKYDHALIALHVQSMMQFHGMNITRAWKDAQRLFGLSKEQVRYAWERCGADAAGYLRHVR